MSQVRLLRRASFSAAHRFWDPGLSREQNLARFGAWASPEYHGHDYLVEANFAGILDERTGMVVNIRDLSQLLKTEVVARFDRRCLNDVAELQDMPPTLENVSRLIRELLEKTPLFSASGESARLVELALFETPSLWVEHKLIDGSWEMTLSRSYEFAASHRLYCEEFSAEKNFELYGKDANPAGHGHNYRLVVSVEGTPDRETGMAVSLEELDRVVNELVVDRYDHRNLNVEIPELAGKVTTCEVILKAIWQVLDGKLPAKLSRLRLRETDRNEFEYTGD